MPDVHALLSASGAAKWLNCPPSARLEEKFPNKSSEYAREGTVAHALAEISAGYNLGNFTKRTFNARKKKLLATEDGENFYNEEMQEHATEYAELIYGKLKEAKENCPDAFAELEVRVDFSKWVPEGFGTGDCIIVADDWLEIIDLKYGKGHRVEAAGNPQMRLYALGAIEYYGQLYDIENVRMTIYQPRLSGVQSSDEITVKELLWWARNVVKPNAELAFAGKGEFGPSEETCKFCRAKEECRARYKKNLALFDEGMDPLLITPDEAGAVLEKAKDIRAWLTDLENLVQSTILSGTGVEGWKIVEGRSNRKIADSTKAVEAFKKAGYEEAVLYKAPELITLTQMEKDFGKKAVAEILAGLIEKPQGKPTLAPESDKRPAFQPEEAILAAFD
ncbi:MAG: DUF2800 domain-containing protein, partial [Lachnospiraceae bacterium]|nr:DUF2800 domain-containing protein [Lachnospiraceae bacterium]